MRMAGMDQVAVAMAEMEDITGIMVIIRIVVMTGMVVMTGIDGINSLLQSR